MTTAREANRRRLCLDCGEPDARLFTDRTARLLDATTIDIKARGNSPEAPHRAWSVKPLCAWYDLWVGVYIDRKSRRLYVLPLPCLGFVVEWP